MRYRAGHDTVNAIIIIEPLVCVKVRVRIEDG